MQYLDCVESALDVYPYSVHQAHFPMSHNFEWQSIFGSLYACAEQYSVVVRLTQRLH
jgi:hypothetical protein